MIKNYLDLIGKVDNKTKVKIKEEVEGIPNKELTTILIGEGNEGMYIYGIHTVSKEFHKEHIEGEKGEWDYYPAEQYKNFL